MIVTAMYPIKGGTTRDHEWPTFVCSERIDEKITCHETWSTPETIVAINAKVISAFAELLKRSICLRSADENSRIVREARRSRVSDPRLPALSRREISGGSTSVCAEMLRSRLRIEARLATRLSRSRETVRRRAVAAVFAAAVRPANSRSTAAADKSFNAVTAVPGSFDLGIVWVGGRAARSARC